MSRVNPSMDRKLRPFEITCTSIGVSVRARPSIDIPSVWTLDFNVYPLALLHGPIAQRLEQATHNRLVPGSNPGGPTTLMKPGIFPGVLLIASSSKSGGKPRCERVQIGET